MSKEVINNIAQNIYANLIAQAIFQGEGHPEFEPAEFVVMASFAFGAAEEFYKYEELDDAQRKRISISSAAQLAATL